MTALDVARFALAFFALLFAFAVGRWHGERAGYRRALDEERPPLRGPDVPFGRDD